MLSMNNSINLMNAGAVAQLESAAFAMMKSSVRSRLVPQLKESQLVRVRVSITLYDKLEQPKEVFFI